MKNHLSLLRTALNKHNQKIIYGIDMSLHNPGLCCIDTDKKLLQLFFFRNRKCEHNFVTVIESAGSVFFGWTLEIVCIEHILDGLSELSFQRFSRYLLVVSKIVAIIGSNSRSKLIGIENYAYNKVYRGFKSKAPQISSSQSVLMELGGCLRTLLTLYNHELKELSPTTIKKQFSGNGRASKQQMYDVVLNVHKFPDLVSACGIQFQHQQIPHPIEDIVDALAVAVTTLLNV